MSREIKFRVFDKYNECIDYDFSVGEFNTLNIELDNMKEDFIVMQYTGLLDKNGIEIYEGDIVNLHFEDEYSNDCVSVDGLTTIKVRVKFDYKGVYGEETDSTWYYFADLISNDVEIEIIGNIYENSELLINN